MPSSNAFTAFATSDSDNCKPAENGWLAVPTSTAFCQAAAGKPSFLFPLQPPEVLEIQGKTGRSIPVLGNCSADHLQDTLDRLPSDG